MIPTLYLRLALAAGLLAALAGGIWWLHHTWWGDGYAACARQDTHAVHIAQRHAQKVVTRVVTRYITRIKVVRGQTRTIVRKVPVYVTHYDNAHCRINVGFVSLWNGANRGLLPSPSGSADEARSAVVLSDVAAEHARESGVCRATEAQLSALQEWVRGVTATSNGH